MNDVINEEIMGEKNLTLRIDNKVLKCYYNICKYYNKNYKIIKQFLGVN